MNEPSPVLAALSEELRRLEAAAHRAEPMKAEEEAALIPLVDRARASLGELADAIEALRA